MLYLEGGVVAESLDPLSRLQRVETEAAVINLKTQDITSDTQVKINGLNFNSQWIEARWKFTSASCNSKGTGKNIL